MTGNMQPKFHLMWRQAVKEAPNLMWQECRQYKGEVIVACLACSRKEKMLQAVDEPRRKQGKLQEIAFVQWQLQLQHLQFPSLEKVRCQRS